ncbi:MAG: DUF427 domain-containing protein [Bifidobacteriaceae bacterium]|nr:DUF427 domain-containing protein [Bifidobacteriaceae bacterium]
MESDSALVVREEGKVVPFFAVPVEDLRGGRLRSADSQVEVVAHPGADAHFDLVTAGVRRAAAWSYPEGGLGGYVGLRFDAFDRWLEEDREVRVHPRTLSGRVDALRSSRHVVVRRGQTVLADSSAPVAVFEGSLTRWYLPRDGVRLDLLTEVPLQTGCPHKGVASYLALVEDPETPIAWYYPEPNPEVGAIAGLIAFFDELVDIEVDGQAKERPVTQWSYGLRDNLKGGGSGLFQGTDSPSDHPGQTGGEPARALIVDLDQSQPGARLHPPNAEGFTIAPSLKRVRGLIGSTVVVDSRSPVLVWAPGAVVPAYAFPRADVRTDLLRPTKASAAGGEAGQRFDLELEGTVYPGLVFEYPTADLREHLAFDWFRRTSPGVEHWYEEEEEVFVHPRSPFSRVDAIPSSRHVQVFLDGERIADTRNPVLLFEGRLPTRYYLPPEDVDFSRLRASDLGTACPYKGAASYWSVETGRGVYRDIVWSYQEPLPAVAAIAGRLAFYNELVDLVVDQVPVERPHTHFSAGLAGRFAPHAPQTGQSQPPRETA